MRDKRLGSFKGKRIEVRAKGIAYTGVLLEATEDYLLIRRTNGHAQIPMSQVTYVELAKTRTLDHSALDAFETPSNNPTTAATSPATVIPETATPANTGTDDDPFALNSSAWGKAEKK